MPATVITHSMDRLGETNEHSVSVQIGSAAMERGTDPPIGTTPAATPITAAAIHVARIVA